jgi:hypothetical protein
MARSTHWIGGWVGPRVSLDNMEKRIFLTLQAFELQLGCSLIWIGLNKSIKTLRQDKLSSGWNSDLAPPEQEASMLPIHHTLLKLHNKTPWSESASELYRPSDRRHNIQDEINRTYSDPNCTQQSLQENACFICGYTPHTRNSQCSWQMSEFMPVIISVIVPWEGHRKLFFKCYF